MTHESQDQDQIAVQARRWVLLLSSGHVEPSQRERFLEWMAADARHAKAYQRSSRVWAGLGQLESLRNSVQLEDLAVDHGAAPAPRRFAPTSRHWAWAAAIAFAILLPLYWTLVSRVPTNQVSAVYATRSAEIRDVTLLDGSVVTLGARSSIRTSFGPDQRQVDLLSGAAFFAVTHDPARPFLVKVDDAVVRVIGTQFEVHRGAETVRVAVVQGRVEVARQSPSTLQARQSAKAILNAGQAALIAKDDSKIEPLLQLGSQSPAAWRSGRLEYIDAPLSEVISDVNRYRTTPIQIVSDEVGRLRITGSFGTDRLDYMLRYLASSLPVELRTDPQGNESLVYRADQGASGSSETTR